MASKRKEKDNLRTCMDIVKFARSNDEARYNINCYSVEPTRIVATDGHRLAWQEFPEAGIETGMISEHGPIKPGLIDDKGKPADDVGEFPAYDALIHNNYRVIFHVSGTKNGTWLQALKALSKASDQPHGTIEANGDGRVRVRFKDAYTRASIELTATIGDRYSFVVGVNLEYLYQALDAARRSYGHNEWIARVSLSDHNSAIRIDNPSSGFYSITGPLRVQGKNGFVQVAEVKRTA